jgi:hypothetical protein
MVSPPSSERDSARSLKNRIFSQLQGGEGLRSLHRSAGVGSFPIPTIPPQGLTALAPGPVKKLNRTSLTDYGFESTAENARGARVPPGGAGAPAHARRKEPIFNFFTASLPERGNPLIVFILKIPHQKERRRNDSGREAFRGLWCGGSEGRPDNPLPLRDRRRSATT